MEVLERTWCKLTEDQLGALGISTYPGEIVLVNTSIPELSVEYGVDHFYFNAQEFFSQNELDCMDYWQ